LLAEVARRRLDIHKKITDKMVKGTYDFGKVLGMGASGAVYEVTHKTTKARYACKIVVKNNSMNDAQSMSTELEIMKRIRHRHVVSMYELYETPKCLWIILEHVDSGDLLHFLAAAPSLNEISISKYFKQILSAVHYIHSLGVVHRDLKLDNILVSVSITSDTDYFLQEYALSSM
jgi:serine/threonine protein kinase